MKQDYSELEDQIGNMGGESQEAPQLGKLKHKASYGQKEELDNTEQQSLNSFINRSNKKMVRGDIDNDTSVSQGWIPINREEMGIRSLFYNPDWEFSIRPATVQAIKNWTAIDETRPEMVNRVFNEIIKTCVRINTNDPQNGASWAQINSWDRFWFVLKVREYTFARGESKIEFDDICQECNEDIKFELTSDSLFYEFPDEDLIEKYWNGSVWQIDPSEYDVMHEPITLYTPKLGKDDAIIEWATARARNNQKIDETFIKFLVWMLPKPSKDPQILDRQIQKIYNEYKSWDVEMFGFMNDVVNNITINPSEKLRCICPSCGQEVTSTVQFPDGIKVLFATKPKAKKFGSR